jgi:hypothetical protein
MTTETQKLTEILSKYINEPNTKNTRLAIARDLGAWFRNYGVFPPPRFVIFSHNQRSLEVCLLADDDAVKKFWEQNGLFVYTRKELCKMLQLTEKELDKLTI